MNTLSWMIYIASAVQSLNIIAGSMFWVSGAIGAFGCVAYVIVGGVGTRDAGAKMFSEWMRPKVKKTLAIFLIASLAAAVIPDEKTIYMIAASEAAGTVVASPEAQEIFNDLKTLIRKNLGEAIRPRSSLDKRSAEGAAQ